MKTEHLEALLLDRALGQLAPEVADLLDDHLARSPVAANRAETFASTLQLARVATTLPVDATTHLAPEAAWRRMAWASRWEVARRETVKMAACLAVGLVIGRAAWKPAPAEVSLAEPPVHTRTANANSTPAAAAFWIDARRLAEAKAAHDLDSPRPATLQWPALESSAKAEGVR
jgi:hypothetical protein